MRLEVDRRKRTIRALPERDEDLYFLYLLISPGDILRGWTVREIKPEGAKEGVRRKVFLAIRVEQLEFHRFRGSLRVRGVVVEGEAEGVKGRRHTFDVAPGREVELVKPEEYPMELVDEVAKMASLSLPRLLLVSIDGDEAAIAHVTALGVEVLATLERGGGRAAEAESQEELLGPFLREVAKAVEQYRLRLRPDRVVVAGPQLYVEMALAYIKGDAVPQSSGGLAGVYEFQRGGLFEEYRKAMGAEVLERALRLAAERPELVAVGVEAVKEAAAQGRVEAAVVADEALKENASEFAEVLRLIYAARGSVKIAPAEGEAGQMLMAMGGVVAVLRY
nr:MAG: mRNA surveillance protein Pelota [Thermoproteus sp. AZ2]